MVEGDTCSCKSSIGHTTHTPLLPPTYKSRRPLTKTKKCLVAARCVGMSVRLRATLAIASLLLDMQRPPPLLTKKQGQLHSERRHAVAVEGDTWSSKPSIGHATRTPLPSPP